MSKAELRGNYYTRLASVQNSCNCSSNSYCYNNNLGKFISKALAVGAFAVSAGSVVSAFVGTVGAARRASLSQATNQTTGSSQVNSIFSYGTDNQTDYATGAVNSLNEQLKQINDAIKTKTDRQTLLNGTDDGSVNKLSENVSNLKTELGDSNGSTGLYGALKKLENDYDTKTGELGTETAKTESRDEDKIAKLRSEIAKLEADIKDKNKAINDKKAAIKKAEDNLKAANEELEKLPKEIEELKKTKKLTEDRIKEYQMLDDANGSAELRATSKEATNKKSIKDTTFDIKNAMQLINEFASARKAYDDKVDKGTATNADKREMKKVAERFLDEYNNGGGKGENATIDNAYSLIEKYVKDLG